MIGLLCAGLFASKAVNPAGADGLFLGNALQLAIQLIAVLATIVYAFGVTYLLLKAVDKWLGLRVQIQEELGGLDLSQHNETAYTG